MIKVLSLILTVIFIALGFLIYIVMWRGQLNPNSVMYNNRIGWILTFCATGLWIVLLTLVYRLW